MQSVPSLKIKRRRRSPSTFARSPQGGGRRLASDDESSWGERWSVRGCFVSRKSTEKSSNGRTLPVNNEIFSEVSVARGDNRPEKDARGLLVSRDSGISLRRVALQSVASRRTGFVDRVESFSFRECLHPEIRSKSFLPRHVLSPL